MRRALLPLLLACGPALAQPAPSRPATDQLLSALKAAPDEQVAAALETRIEQAWLNAGSPAVTLLMSRALREMSSGAQAEALDDFDAVLDLDPELAEAYARRAVARFDTGDINGAIADVQQALKREPRHFEAFQILSRIAENRGNPKGAFAAWQKVLEIDPHTPGGAARLNELRRKAFGEET